MDYPTMAYETLVKRANRFHKSEMAKVNAFANTADILIKEGDFAIATFNMHQAFELSFRFIEQMCIGRSMVTHSIISHINYCKHFFPTLQPFKESSSMENNELLLLLEHAYSVARYGNEFEITKVQTKTIQSQMKDFIQEVESIFHRHLDQCKDRIEGIGKDFEKAFPKVTENEGSNSQNDEAKQQSRPRTFSESAKERDISAVAATLDSTIAQNMRDIESLRVAIEKLKKGDIVGGTTNLPLDCTATTSFLAPSALGSNSSALGSSEASSGVSEGSLLAGRGQCSGLSAQSTCGALIWGTWRWRSAAQCGHCV